MLKNKNILIISVLTLIILLTIEPVHAASCNGLLTQGAYDMIQDAINIIRLIVPILLLVLGSVDFGSVVLSDDKDGLKKATGKFVKRCIAAVAIFFIPLIVRTVLNMPGIKDNINLVDDPLCGIE